MIDVENQSLEHIARILRADKDDVLKAVSRFETVTGKQDIVPRLAAENTTRIDNCLSALGLARAAAAPRQGAGRLKARSRKRSRKRRKKKKKRKSLPCPTRQLRRRRRDQPSRTPKKEKEI